MTGRDGLRTKHRRRPFVLGPILLLFLCAAPIPTVLHGQTTVPRDQFHLSITLGGYSLLGVGYTHFIEEHHALEFTVFPLAWPAEGFPFGLRAGYAWVPSDEVWRAKLGGNFTVLVHPKKSGGDRFTPIIGLTPGLQYDPDSDRSLRADVWMSYYLKQHVFLPTGVEFIYAWPK